MVPVIIPFLFKNMFLAHALAQGIMSEISARNRVYLCICLLNNKVVEALEVRVLPNRWGRV